jgi:hypothetical protein
MAENLQINQILELVQQTNKSLEKKYFIPSLKTEVLVKPMTAGHLKQIVTSSLSGIFANNKFNQIVYSIIQEILVDKQIVSKLNTLDKIAILLQLRRDNVKKTITLYGYLENDSLTNATKVQDIDELIEKIKATDFQLDDVVVKVDNFEVVLNFPLLDQENQHNLYMEQTYSSKIDENDKSAIKTFFGPLFIGEIVQYIKSVKIGEQLVDFMNLSTENRIKIFESLSGPVVSEVMENIDKKLGNQIRDTLTVRFKNNSISYYIAKIDLDISILT